MDGRPSLVKNAFYQDDTIDWNRRPLVGRAASTRRRSPWAARV
jgi:hypothetical protein